MKHRKWQASLCRRIWLRLSYHPWRIKSLLRYRLTGWCGNGCGWTEPYGFVPECGCPIHDFYRECIDCGKQIHLDKFPKFVSEKKLINAKRCAGCVASAIWQMMDEIGDDNEEGDL